jgi:hypothetical protein
MPKLQESTKRYRGWNLYHTGYSKWRAAKVEGNKVKYIIAFSEAELKMKIDQYIGR